MKTADLGYVVLGVLAVLPALLIGWWYRRHGRDEIFEGITPGEVPGVGHQVRRVRVGGSGEWAGPVAVRFTPPDGVTPGLIGTVIDGRADTRDLSATLIDLAVRGYFRISPVTAEPPTSAGTGTDTPPAARPRRDFLLTLRTGKPGQAGLTAPELTLLTALRRHAPAIRLSELGPDFAQAMREAQVDLYREVVERRWYTQHPRIQGRRLGCLLTAVTGLIGLFLVAVMWVLLREHQAGALGFVFPAGVLAAAYLLFRGARKRSARTADGTAARIQALGFREYLTKAEASQIRFEEAADLFSRYLPYAIVFEVADRWARLFGEVAATAHLAGVGSARFDLSWFDAADLADLGTGTLDILDGAHGLADLTDLLGAAGGLVETVGTGLSGLAEEVGGFASSVGDLVSGGDGCDLGGCDLPGCDLP